MREVIEHGLHIKSYPRPKSTILTFVAGQHTTSAYVPHNAEGILRLAEWIQTLSNLLAEVQARVDTSNSE